MALAKKKKGTFLACGLGGGGRRGQTPEIKFKKNPKKKKLKNKKK